MAKIFHADLHGLSGIKDKALLTLDIAQTNWLSVDIEASSFYLLIPQNSCLRREYDQGWKVTDVFPVNVMGFQTHRDHFAIDFEPDELEQRIGKFRDLHISDLEIKSKYNIADSPSWKVRQARLQLQQQENWKEDLITCHYRPFDLRYCYFSKITIDRPRQELINHVAGRDNLCLGLGRQGIAVNDPEWALVSVSSNPADANLFRRGGVNVFPLYVYPTTPAEIKMGITRKPNISDEFLTELERTLGYTPTPETIFYYIYAILHSPTYRTRYAEFLKIDFPCVPITSDDNLFRHLGELGEKLVNLHLMKSLTLGQKTSSPFVENGGGGIVDAGHPKYANGKVIVNKKQDCFVNVPEEVWNFHVGGYQVCQKWLKDRKGRTLSPDDISYYQKIVIALGQTIELMTKIDEAIPNWPIQ